MATHPSQRFKAPSSITAGQALKDLMSPDLVRLIAESLQAVNADFDEKSFRKQAKAGLDGELTPRAQHIAAAMDAHLPAEFSQSVGIVVASFGPELTATEGYGLAPFYYLPHSHWLAKRGVDDLALGLDACAALTTRFTSEFCIRPLIIADQRAVLKRLKAWAKDANPHLRRLVSEGTRPRLPWAQRLPALIADPGPVLPLLKTLRDDPERYVQRSVANHLGDIGKDHLDLLFDTCADWLTGLDALEPKVADNRRWLIRHALRHPDKKGEPRARSLREQAGARPKKR
jgi:3-methyladenine DNA glycosylase AlkC